MTWCQHSQGQNKGCLIKDPLEHLASPLSFLSLSSLSPLFFSLSFPFSLSLKLKFYKSLNSSDKMGTWSLSS